MEERKYPLTFICSKSTTETLQKGVKLTIRHFVLVSCQLQAYFTPFSSVSIDDLTRPN